jgi:2-amino-4-hydroxy-6-hydroxymethyldihydropteridine diphosphokinase
MMEGLIMKRAFLGIGSNLGKREDNLRIAIGRIVEETGRIEAVSSVYETEPWGFETDNLFLNMVVKVETSLEPQALLEALLRIEKSMGRRRDKEFYSSRIIDIDILFYDDIILNENYLKIPHPHLHERRFVLEPLAEIAPDFIHPVFNKKVSSLLELCKDSGRIRKI